MLLRFVTVGLIAVAAPTLAAQSRVEVSGGDVASRMSTRVPGVTPEMRSRLRVSGDSAQRLALRDFAWKGRVISLEIDEQDSRLFWDVKIEPDARPGTVVRYRVDATGGGILGIKEFATRSTGRRP